MNTSPVAARLLNQIGYYLHARARYEEAEPLLKRTLVIYEQQLGTKHPDTAQSLNNLATLYYTQGKYAEAKPLLQRALLAVNEQQLGSQYPTTQAIRANYTALLSKMKVRKRRNK